MAPPPRPGEFDLIARYFAPMAGPGGLGLIDDAALLTPPPGCDLVLSKDALVAGVHFFPDDPPFSIAQKALRVNLSDLAAKGARPLGFLLGLGLPANWTEAWLAEFAKGLAFDAAHYGCPLLGGDTVKAGERLVLSVTILGAVSSGTMVRRSGGQAGDLLYVTGVIGMATLGLMLRRDPDAGWAAGISPSLRELARASYLVPEPATPLTEAIRTHARAAMDISDGLIGDARKLAAASGAALEIDLARVPLAPGFKSFVQGDPAVFQAVLTGGDDYQVLAAIPPERAESFEQEARELGHPLTCIGRLIAGDERLIGLDGREVTFTSASFAHF